MDDLDSDGDSDVFYSSDIAGEIRWHENLDGRGSFSKKRVLVSNLEGATKMLPIDLDVDGDLDFLTFGSFNGLTGSRITWYENRPIADSNDDGVFDSSDLIAAFSAGEYEDDVSGNSTFLDGDWNGDGEFNSSDLIFAFQNGSYVGNARPAPNLVGAAVVDSLFQRS